MRFSPNILQPSMILALVLSAAAQIKLRDDWRDISNYYALGDSYAAGIGCGRQLDHSCERYDGAYSHRVVRDERFSSRIRENFHHLACSGGIMPDVVATQLPLIADGTADLITLTIGGNDAGFANYLNDCVYAWATPKPCLPSFAGRNKLTTSLWAPLDVLLERVVHKLSPNAHVLLTSYAQFYDITTTECDDVTLAWWGPWTAGRTFLTQELRGMSNDALVHLNSVLRRACEAWAPRCVFVDIDEPFTAAEGRFCEPGVSEPKKNRPGLLFFEEPTSRARRSRTAVGLNTFPQARRHAGETHIEARKEDGTWTGQKKIFHPRNKGQELIAEAVAAALETARENDRDEFCWSHHVEGDCSERDKGWIYDNQPYEELLSLPEDVDIMEFVGANKQTDSKTAM